MEKLFCVLLFSSLLLLASPAHAQKFSDVQANSELHYGLTELRSKEVISGYQDGTFRPNQQVTRGQLAKMIAVALSLKPADTNISFTDVPSTHANFAYIQALVSKNIIRGYPDGTFRPNATVTRAQAAKMIAIAFEVPSIKEALPFKDIAPKSERAETVSALYFNGITSGTTSDTYSPGNAVTRGQAALFIFRAWELYKGAVIHEITVKDVQEIELIDQQGVFYKTVIVGNTIRLLPLFDGSDTLLIKGDDNTYVMYEIRASNQKIATTTVDWQNYVDVTLHYYELSNLDISFTPTSATLKNADKTTVSADYYFFQADSVGMEIGIFTPGRFELTVADMNGNTKTFKVVTSIDGLRIESVIYK